MPRYKPMTLGRMPRVFVAILALDEPQRLAVLLGISTMLKSHEERVVREIEAGGAEMLHRLLELPKDVRRPLSVQIDSFLDTLYEQDFFGTEGQLDPRGDRRG